MKILRTRKERKIFLFFCKNMASDTLNVSFLAHSRRKDHSQTLFSSLLQVHFRSSALHADWNGSENLQTWLR